MHGGDHGMHGMPTRYSTTILSVRKDGKLAVIGDGQMTAGNMVVKPNTRKVRRIGDDNVIVGFAGSTADALALLERLESKLEAYGGQLPRACVELAKDWRTEKYMRRLEAALIVANSEVTLEVTGNGDVLEPADGVLAIGSGSPFATAAARALMHTDFTAMQIAERAMTIAGDMCVYTNHNWVKDEMDLAAPAGTEEAGVQ
jgi:ATP-dependent HslUV protease subunit HslV